MLIGLTGVAGVGKDTTGEILSGLLNLSRYAFAQPVKSNMNGIFGWDERHSGGSLKEEKVYTKVVHMSEVALRLNSFLGSITPEKEWRNNQLNFFEVFRPFLVFDNLGYAQWNISPRKAYQLFGTDFARNMVSESIWVDIAPKGDTIFTDVRFNDEAEFIREAGGIVIEVQGRATSTGESSHVSEGGVSGDLIDYVLDNSGTKKQLKTNVKKLVDEITK